MDKVERLTNLLLVLLDTDVPLSLQQIVHTVEGYPEGHDAYRQAFERDKRLLREQGVTVSVEPVPGSDVAGYRIRPEDYYLPDLELDEAEQRALNLALAAVNVDALASREAAWKLGAVGAPGPRWGGPMAEVPSAPALPVIYGAMRAGRPVRFRHRDRARIVDPYGLLFRHGFWYIVGRDHDRDAPRTFRVDRIEGLPEVLEGPVFERPTGFDPAGALAEDPWSMGEGEALAARIWVGPLHARRVEWELGGASIRERSPDGSVLVEIKVVNPAAFITWVLGMLDDAEVLGPEELRQAVVDWVGPLVPV